MHFSKLYSLVLVLFFFTSVEAQKEFSNWYFGTRAGLDFNTEPVSYHLDGQSFFGLNPATISDAAGNMLFYYSNGVIYNRDHNVMSNGQNIGDLSNPYGNLVVPRPNSTDIYYLFTSSWNSLEEENPIIFYSVIDMTLNNGLGGVTNEKNVQLTTINMAPKLTAVQHANDIDFWIVGHGLNNSEFLSFKITENGIETIPVISNSGSIHPFNGGNFGGALGGIRISHDAKRIGVVFQEDVILDGENSNPSILEVMDFDDETGRAEGHVLRVGENTFFDSANADGTGAAQFLEFSPNNQYIYVSASNTFANEEGILYPSALFQFDVTVDTDEEFLFSAARLYSGLDRIWNVQWGLDDKIYVASNNDQEVTDNNLTLLSLGVINNPNNSGLGANYEHLSVSLSEDSQDVRVATIGLPQDIRQFFYLKIQSNEFCGGIGRYFTLDTSNDIISVLWDFGDGTTSTDIDPEHTYLPGAYSVSVTVTYENSVITRNILVQIPDTLNVAVDGLLYCDDSSNDGIVTVNFLDLENAIFRPGECGITSYHFTQNEAENNINPISEDFNISGTQIIYFRLEQEFNSNNVVITPITLSVGVFPELQSMEYNLCRENNEDISINTSELNSLFSGNLECAIITYYDSSSNANSGLNPLTGNLVLSESLTIIYVRIFDTINNTFTVTPIEINLKDKPILDLQDVYYICPNQDLVINPGSFDRYLWSTGNITQQINIDTTGSYSVEVFNDVEGEECKDSHTFTVENSDIPESFDLIINDLSINNSIEVLSSGIGNYEYSLDGFTYQDIAFFNNLTQSDYTVYIRDKNGCGVVTINAFLLIQPKFFTPNQDGVNDFWQIKSAFSEPDLKIEIYNRYGKLLIAFNGNSQGWDGTFNGLDLPTNDYWYKVYRPSNKRIYSGHFTLKR